MRKVIFFMFMGLSLFFMGCGNLKLDDKEDPGKKKIEDSLTEEDRNNALDNADKLLQQADSIEKAKQDSIEMAAKKGKK
jgi:hypothetical protein